MGTIKERNGMDLTETEDIKKRWQEYTEELYKKDLHDPDNHGGVITHLEPDILECKVRWALEASVQTKLVEVMEFQLSDFKSWKTMLCKCCTQYASKFGKLSSGHRTGKGQFSFQYQGMLKLPHNYTHLTPANAQNSPSQASKVHEAWSSRCSSWIQKRQRNQRSNCQHPLDHWKSKRVPEKHLFLLYWLCQSLWLCGSQ